MLNNQPLSQSKTNSQATAENYNNGKNSTVGKPLRFVIIGVSNTIVDFLLMNLLKFAGLPLLTSNTISTGTAMAYSFFMNKKWTFRNSGSNYAREVVLFFVFTIIGIWVIQNGFIWLITTYLPHFGLSDFIFNNLAKLIASVPSLTWNYLTYDRFVFSSKPATPDKR